MGLQIEDGLGRGNSVSVRDDNKIETYAVSESALHYRATLGNSYSWTAVSADVAAGVGGIYLANDSTVQDLFITKIYLWADVPNQFKIWCPATYTAPDGTSVVGLNFNRASGKSALATCTAGETNNAFAAAQTLLTVRTDDTLSGGGIMIDLQDSLVLGYHNSVEVELVADTAAFEATIWGWYR